MKAIVVIICIAFVLYAAFIILGTDRYTDKSKYE